VAFSRWFGSGRLHAAHLQHPAALHRDVFRVSNDAALGCWEDGGGVGSGGFHNDGAFMPAPYSHSVYQIVTVRPAGSAATVFANVNKCLADALGAVGVGGRAALDGLAELRTVSDVTGLEHPLLFHHPETHRALLLQGGWRSICRATGADGGDGGREVLAAEEQTGVRRRLRALMSNEAAYYRHIWVAGDVVVTDNLAVAHKAEPQPPHTGGGDGGGERMRAARFASVITMLTL
jgi:taurine dioxygenase